MGKASIENGNGGKVISELFEFLTIAKRHAHYPPNTAASAKAALRLVSSILTEQEAASVATFRSNLDAIFQRAFNAHQSRVSALSLQSYRSKIKMLLADFEKYGSNPQAMASWKRQTRKTNSKASLKDSAKSETRISDGEQSEEGESAQAAFTLNRLEVALRPDLKAVLLIPRDITAPEAKRIKALLDACVVTD